MLEARGKALEEQFFKKQNAEKIAKMRENKAREAVKECLRKESGMTDESVLDKLVELGISAETVHALSLVPLVMIGWADETMHDHEREAILQAAVGKGIDEGSSSHQLLGDWLKNKPTEELFVTWEAYIAALLEHLTVKQRQILSAQVVDRARDIATVAGGFLGIATISDAEETALKRLEAAFNT